MVLKNNKLRKQFDAEASGSYQSGYSSRKSLFPLVFLFLWMDILSCPIRSFAVTYYYGGQSKNYFSRHHATRIICNNLHDCKIKNRRSFIGGLPVVKSTQVQDSIAANKILSWIPYLLNQLARGIHSFPIYWLGALVRVWDTTTASSSSRSSCCVGMTSIPGNPVGMKCHESLLYVAAGSSVIAIDLRTMHRVSTVMEQVKLHSFEVMPSKSLICTGGTGRAMLWDIRKSSYTPKVEPVLELDGHVGPIKLLRMDQYKVVAGGLDDSCINVWDVDTGKHTNSLICSQDSSLGCSAMVVDGCRLVTVSGDEEQCLLRFRDFDTATCLISSAESETGSPVSKFWGPQSIDSESSDY